MLASRLGFELDANKAWDERKKLYIAGKDRQFVSRSIAKSAHGHKDGQWTTVVALAVMLLLQCRVFHGRCGRFFQVRQRRAEGRTGAATSGPFPVVRFRSLSPLNLAARLRAVMSR